MVQAEYQVPCSSLPNADCIVTGLKVGAYAGSGSRADKIVLSWVNPAKTYAGGPGRFYYRCRSSMHAPLLACCRVRCHYGHDHDQWTQTFRCKSAVCVQRDTQGRWGVWDRIRVASSATSGWQIANFPESDLDEVDPETTSVTVTNVNGGLLSVNFQYR